MSCGYCLHRVRLSPVFDTIVVATAVCATTLERDPSDSAITTRVTTAFLRDAGLTGMAIQADTMSGIVTLTGRVRSVVVAREAERLARSIDGVIDVVVRLQITPDPPG